MCTHTDTFILTLIIKIRQILSRIYIQLHNSLLGKDSLTQHNQSETICCSFFFIPSTLKKTRMNFFCKCFFFLLPSLLMNKKKIIPFLCRKIFRIIFIKATEQKIYFEQIINCVLLFIQVYRNYFCCLLPSYFFIPKIISSIHRKTIYKLTI